MSALAQGMSAQQALALPLPAASNTVVINARCSLRVEADQRVIVVGGLPVHHYRAEDAVAEAVLAHRPPGIVGVYDVHQYADEKREALELWAQHLAKITNPVPTAPAKVVKLAGRRR